MPLQLQDLVGTPPELLQEELQNILATAVTVLESNAAKSFIVQQKERKNKREQIKSEKSPDGECIPLSLL